MPVKKILSALHCSLAEQIQGDRKGVGKGVSTTQSTFKTFTCFNSNANMYKVNKRRIFLSGAETTSTSILWTLLYLAVWPKKQRKLQEELDTVLGKESPSLTKKASLPYLQATIYEALRLSSLTPLGVPRKATKSTRLGGFDIPKGTTVMFNLYAMNHDHHVWENPHEFIPERFLDDKGEFYPSRVGFLPFSAGKRVCLGESVAKMELFLILANLLQHFEFKSDCDLDLEGVNGATLKPKPFKLLILSRF